MRLSRIRVLFICIAHVVQNRDRREKNIKKWKTSHTFIAISLLLLIKLNFRANVDFSMGR